MGLFEPMHLIIILAIALVIFGPGKVGDLGGSMGRAVRDFKKAMSEDTPPSPSTTAQTAQSQQPEQIQHTAETPIEPMAATTKETVEKH